MLKKDKKDLTVREHLKMIQSDSWKALGWARSCQRENFISSLRKHPGIKDDPLAARLTLPAIPHHKVSDCVGV